MRSNKGGKHDYYYVNQNSALNRNTLKKIVSRLPAYEIETLVLKTISSNLAGTQKLSSAIGLDLDKNYKTLTHISNGASTTTWHKAIHKVIVDTDRG